MSIEKAKRDYHRASLMAGLEDDMNMDLRLKIPRSAFEMWQGIKAAHGLNEDFLEFVLSRMMIHTMIQFVQMTDFAE